MKALPILLVLLMLWSAIWRPGPGDYVARELELELPTAQTTDTYDDHGGFHGDGLLHTELTFSPEDGARVGSMLQRSSFNYTLAVYDSAAATLSYLEFDT